MKILRQIFCSLFLNFLTRTKCTNNRALKLGQERKIQDFLSELPAELHNKRLFYKLCVTAIVIIYLKIL